MEKKQSPKYYCQKPGCLALFMDPSEHSQHKNSILSIPTELSAFDFKQKIGQGSYGAVFKVYDPQDKQEKALKLISIDDSSFSDGDIDTLKKLYHQNIIRYFGSGVLGEDCAYVLMELCDYDLESMIKSKKLTTFDQQMEIFKQICKGVQYFHNLEIIHRDLKPNNIMIKDGNVRISDFGTSKTLQGSSSETLAKGTPIYTPPEYVNSLDDSEKKIMISTKHDMFSLGIIAHQIFSDGQHPFQLGGSILSNILIGKYKMNSDLIQQDSIMDTIIKGCLLPNPETRLSITDVVKLIKTPIVPIPDQKSIAMKSVINTQSSISDPADLWNNLMQGEDEKSIMKMIKQCGGSSIKDAHILIGKPIKCYGSTGFGTYNASITKVDLGKGWLEVLWTVEQYTTWKTAKLCWME